MDRRAFEELIAPYDRIVVGVGTGNGLFVYQFARQNPQTFFIGFDANRPPLEKISHKIYRKPAKGGLSNALFLQASAETLPDELSGLASEVHVNFPWGSLLRAVLGGDEIILRNLRGISAPDGLFKVVIGIDVAKDRAEMERLGLTALSDDYVNNVMAAKYLEAGFEINHAESLSRSALRQRTPRGP